MTRPTVLFYCQHLLGIGHISRSLALCRRLVQRFDVVFLQGGPDIGRTIDHPNFEHVFLPPLLMREQDSALYDPKGEHDVETLWQLRAAALSPVLRRPFDAVVVELFPFGRNKFKPEIFDIITRVRAVQPGVQVYCSNRDIMVQKPDQARREDKIVSILTDYFDHVLVHSDPTLIRMDETFAATARIADQVVYTGFVTEGEPADGPPSPRENRILVSLGGGVVGEEMAFACARVAPAFPDYRMDILTGPYTTAKTLATLHDIAGQSGSVRVRGFSDDFRGDLARSRLSISLAGYNTLMDILSTATPALVYPYMANREQNMRAAALAGRGLLGVLYQETLVPERLMQAIRSRLAAPMPEPDVDLSGAETTARIIAEHVSGRGTGAVP